MIILYQSNPEVKRILDDILSTGKYLDYSEIINLAIMNLAVLQNELDKGGVLLDSVSETNNEMFLSNEFSNLISNSSLPNIMHKTKTNYSQDDKEILEKPKISKPPYQLPKVEIMEGELEDVTVDKWLFGQHNRLLPAKVSCRAIANFMNTELGGISLNVYGPIIANAAADLAIKLRKYDKKFELKRDDTLATAFPAAGDRKHKGIERYISQFIGQMTRDGKVIGLLSDLKLILKVDGSEDKIELTDSGWEFAYLTNPILDDTIAEKITSLSDEEREYLINHVLKKVTIERSAFSTLIKYVNSGVNTPTLIDDKLKSSLSSEKTDEFSDSFLSSQRSGAISRMVDLDLVRRERDGIYVKYIVAKSGKLFLTKIQI